MPKKSNIVSRTKGSKNLSSPKRRPGKQIATAAQTKKTKYVDKFKATRTTPSEKMKNVTTKALREKPLLLSQTTQESPCKRFNTPKSLSNSQKPPQKNSPALLRAIKVELPTKITTPQAPKDDCKSLLKKQTKLINQKRKSQTTLSSPKVNSPKGKVSVQKSVAKSVYPPQSHSSAEMKRAHSVPQNGRTLLVRAEMESIQATVQKLQECGQIKLVGRVSNDRNRPSNPRALTSRSIPAYSPLTSRKRKASGESPLQCLEINKPQMNGSLSRRKSDLSQNSTEQNIKHPQPLNGNQSVKDMDKKEGFSKGCNSYLANPEERKRCITCRKFAQLECTQSSCIHCCIKSSKPCPAHDRQRKKIAEEEELLKPRIKCEPKLQLVKGSFSEEAFKDFEETATIWCFRDFLRDPALYRDLLETQVRALRARQRLGEHLFKRRKEHRSRSQVFWEKVYPTLVSNL